MHIPVLLHEVIRGLELKEGESVVDATLGDGGHSALLCERVGKDGTVIGIDEDRAALERAKGKLTDKPCSFIPVKDNFENLDLILDREGFSKVDAFLFDLGLRTGHLEESGRGFSFKRDEPLLMTFASSPDEGVLTAYEIINSWSEEDLVFILKTYGEESCARRIAKTIIASRKKKPIGTTFELVEILEKSIPIKFQKERLHFATKTFQAFRIATNNELEVLLNALEKASERLKKGGRIAVISYHSLEDRIVKRYFKKLESEGGFEIITKKPIVPTNEEVAKNPKARSGKLRIIRKIY